MLRVGAENVAAAEIERVIQTVPGVFEVAVVAKPHEFLSEVPAAFVIPLSGAPDDLAERILGACREQLADFKVPSEVILVSELPRSTLNKVSKKDLRARFAAPSASK